MAIVRLPIDEAVTLVAKQNMERDVRTGVTETGDRKIPEFVEEYVDEARAILESTGENHAPEDSDHDHIYVKQD